MANVPFNDVSMEKMRVEKFGELKDEDCEWVNFVFSKISFSKFFLEALTFRGCNGIYSRVCMEYEKSSI